MKKYFSQIFVAAFVFAAVFTSCEDDKEKEESAPSKIVAVAAQNGTLTAGKEGTVTFSVTTENIANGSYDVAVANRPAGITVQGQVTISFGSGTLTMAGDATTTAGITSNLVLTIDGATSATFALVIDATLPKTVVVGEQNGTLTAGETGTVTFAVTTENIANGSYTVAVANLPVGVTVQGNVTISDNGGTLTLAGNASTVASITTTLTLGIDGEISSTFTLTIISPATFFSGAGTNASPFEIFTAEQLAKLAELVNDPATRAEWRDKYYKLCADIDLSAYGENYNDGKGWIPISSFNGHFDGDGKKITELYINNDLADVGLFGSIGGTVTNLGIEIALAGIKSGGGAVAISGVGGVAGSVGGANITNCYVIGAVRGDGDRQIAVGGVVGDVRGSRITNCYTIGTVSGRMYVGGVVGIAWGSPSISFLN